MAIIAERMKAGEPAVFAFVPDLLGHLRSAFAPSSEVPYDTLFEQVKKAPSWCWTTWAPTPPPLGGGETLPAAGLPV